MPFPYFWDSKGTLWTPFSYIWGSKGLATSVFVVVFPHVTQMSSFPVLHERRCRTFWGFERRRWYLINKETTKEGNKMLIVTVTNPQLQMVPLLQTTKRLWWSGNMMKDDYGSDDEEELFIKETPRELLNWIKIYKFYVDIYYSDISREITMVLMIMSL